jgi:hypothetical protein
VGEAGSEFIIPQGNGFVVVDADTTSKLKTLGLSPKSKAAGGTVFDPGTGGGGGAPLPPLPPPTPPPAPPGLPPITLPVPSGPSQGDIIDLYNAPSISLGAYDTPQPGWFEMIAGGLIPFWASSPEYFYLSNIGALGPEEGPFPSRQNIRLAEMLRRGLIPPSAVGAQPGAWTPFGTIAQQLPANVPPGMSSYEAFKANPQDNLFRSLGGQSKLIDTLLGAGPRPQALEAALGVFGGLFGQEFDPTSFVSGGGGSMLRSLLGGGIGDPIDPDAPEQGIFSQFFDKIGGPIGGFMSDIAQGNINYQEAALKLGLGGALGLGALDQTPIGIQSLASRGILPAGLQDPVAQKIELINAPQIPGWLQYLGGAAGAVLGGMGVSDIITDLSSLSTHGNKYAGNIPGKLTWASPQAQADWAKAFASPFAQTSPFSAANYGLTSGTLPTSLTSPWLGTQSLSSISGLSGKGAFDALGLQSLQVPQKGSDPVGGDKSGTSGGILKGTASTAGGSILPGEFPTPLPPAEPRDIEITLPPSGGSTSPPGVSVGAVEGALSPSLASLASRLSTQVQSSIGAQVSAEINASNEQTRVLQQILAAVQRLPNGDDYRDIFREAQDTSGF